MQGVDPLDQIMRCVEEKKNFVLQGGAGSGKTETLKETLEKISAAYPEASIACITHTNFAARQISERVGSKPDIATIHSFLHSHVGQYKKNIHSVISKLFEIEPIERSNVEAHASDADFRKFEHDNFKRVHKKFADLLYRLKKETTEKVVRKNHYEKDPEKHNAELNNAIQQLNQDVRQHVAGLDHKDVRYNETRFDSLQEATYGHDGLLQIACLLAEEFPVIRQIFKTKFDFVFIDEYQDTNPDIIHLFIELLSSDGGPVIGLFGDSVQAIYSDGIGDVDDYVVASKLTRVEKEDNYRCSEQVIDFANSIRYDGLTQQVALKDGEELKDRQGNVDLYYAVVEDKPGTFSSQADKSAYLAKLDKIIGTAKEGANEYTVLKLTNKSISRDAGYPTLFEIFNERYIQPKDDLERILELLQFKDLFEICDAYQPFCDSNPPDFNLVIQHLKQQGFKLRRLEDKIKVQKNIRSLINSGDSALETLKRAFDLDLIHQSESCKNYLQRLTDFTRDCEANAQLQQFKTIYEDEGHTFPKFQKHIKLAENPLVAGIPKEEFEDLERDLKMLNFYTRLVSAELPFAEILNYFQYMNEYLDIVTMHQTKGGEIENVLVVLDEYFWFSEYKFVNAFNQTTDKNLLRKNANLIYVACTRAKTNLRCVRLVKDDIEETLFLKYFPNSTRIDF